MIQLSGTSVAATQFVRRTRRASEAGDGQRALDMTDRRIRVSNEHARLLGPMKYAQCCVHAAFICALSPVLDALEFYPDSVSVHFRRVHLYHE